MGCQGLLVNIETALREIRPYMTLIFGKRAIKVLLICMKYHLSNTFPMHYMIIKWQLPNIRKGLVKMTFLLHLQYLNGSLSKSLRSLKVYFRAVL